MDVLVMCCMMAVSTAPAAGQEVDAYVAPFGTLRLSAGGTYSGFGSLFGADGSQRLGAALSTPLTAASVAALRPLQSALGGFFSATQDLPGASPVPLTEETFTLGTPDVAVFQNIIDVPLRIGVGIFPRVEIGATLPLVRGERLIERAGLGGGTLGVNPDPSGNAGILAQVGAGWGELGSARFLPTDSSALGRELQARVLATTGQRLDLPDSARVAALQALLVDELGLDSLAYRLGTWRPGDVRVDARVRLIDGLAGKPFPTDSTGVWTRVAVGGGLRIATGTSADTASLFPITGPAGVEGFFANAAADVFIGDRWWVSGSADYYSSGSTEIVAIPSGPGGPLSGARQPVIGTWHGPDGMSLTVAPRYRLAEAISVGLEYTGGESGEETVIFDAGAFEGPGGPPQDVRLQGGMSHLLGLGFRYSTLPGFAAGGGMIPLEANLVYRRALTGPEGGPVATSYTFSGSIFVPVLGGGPGR